MKEYPRSLREYRAKASTMMLLFLITIKTRKKFGKTEDDDVVIPEFLYDSTTGDSQRDSSHGSNC